MTDKKTTIAVCIGESRDARTNRWRLTCPACGHSFEPLTTRLANQEVSCPKPKCNAELVARYNEEPPVVEFYERVSHV